MQSYGIKTVVDVRSFPTSRFAHFRRENLERLLKSKDIGYVYLGRTLGAHRFYVCGKITLEMPSPLYRPET